MLIKIYFITEEFGIILSLALADEVLFFVLFDIDLMQFYGANSKQCTQFFFRNNINTEQYCL